MELSIAILLVVSSLLAAILSVGYRRWAALVKRSLPESDSRPWWQRAGHALILRLSYESFFRAFYLHVTFAGTAVAAAAIEGYKPASPLDAWTNPLFPLFLCLGIGCWTQFGLNDDVIDKLKVSLWRLSLVLFFGLLTGLAYFYAVWLSVHCKLMH